MKNRNAKLKLPIIKIFVYGTLRKGQRLGFYMDGAKYAGLFYTQGQLFKAQNGSVYIDFDYNNAVTIGEIYYVDFYCLQRINHLELFSGVFPEGYELNVMPVWELKEEKLYDFDDKYKEWAFFYKRRNSPVKILTGDYTDDFRPFEELEKIILSCKEFNSEDLIIEMRNKLSIFENYNF